MAGVFKLVIKADDVGDLRRFGADRADGKSPRFALVDKLAETLRCDIAGTERMREKFKRPLGGQRRIFLAQRARRRVARVGKNGFVFKLLQFVKRGSIFFI